MQKQSISLKVTAMASLGYRVGVEAGVPKDKPSILTLSTLTDIQEEEKPTKEGL